MNTVKNTISESWDLGLSDLIEETPAIAPEYPAQFEEVTKANGTNVYMLRQKPSWSHLMKRNQA